MFELSDILLRLAMSQNMRIQIGLLGTLVSTANDSAVVWFLACVNFHVCPQIELKGEPLSTHTKGTNKGLFSCVNDHVSH